MGFLETLKSSQNSLKALKDYKESLGGVLDFRGCPEKSLGSLEALGGGPVSSGHSGWLRLALAGSGGLGWLGCMQASLGAVQYGGG
jgi:hypothetical protein